MLKAFVTSLDTVDEKFRSLYKQVEGGFLLQVEKVGGYEIADTTNLLKALETERTNVKTEQTKVKDLEGKVATATARADTANKDIETRVREGVKAQTDELAKTHAEALKAEQDKTAGLIKHVNVLAIETEADAAIAELGANGPLLRHHLIRQMKAVEIGGKFEGRVVREDGTERMTVDGGSSVPMRAKHLLAELRKDPNFAPAFPGTKNSGGGATGGGKQGGAGDAPVDKDKMTPQQKLAEGRKQRAAGT